MTAQPKPPRKKAPVYVFIDTNIFLDFYRIRSSDVSIKYLDMIKEHMGIIITTGQVEMEFKKNRQNVLSESLSGLSKLKMENFSFPVIISDMDAVEKVKQSRKDIEDNRETIKTRIENILSDPISNDIVYSSLQLLFTNSSSINLNRENEVRYPIRKLAKKRFLLGFPPRKKDDNSIGDAINWEWIVKCAESSGKDIILVSRDSDFGCSYNGKYHLNDWLKQEFEERVGSDRKIVLIASLGKAFQLVNLPVTEEMIQEEDLINKSRMNFDFQDIIDNLNNKLNLEQIKNLSEFYNIKFTDYINKIDDFNKLLGSKD